MHWEYTTTKGVDRRISSLKIIKYETGISVWPTLSLSLQSNNHVKPRRIPRN